jgi:hypothetical protein
MEHEGFSVLVRTGHFSVTSLSPPNLFKIHFNIIFLQVFLSSRGFLPWLCSYFFSLSCVIHAPPVTNSLTHGAEPFLRSCQLCSLSRTSQRFMEPEGSLPHCDVMFLARFRAPYTAPFTPSSLYPPASADCLSCLGNLVPDSGAVKTEVRPLNFLWFVLV